jgi:hypothetical protein
MFLDVINDGYVESRGVREEERLLETVNEDARGGLFHHDVWVTKAFKGLATRKSVCAKPQRTSGRLEWDKHLASFISTIRVHLDSSKELSSWFGDAEQEE